MYIYIYTYICAQTKGLHKVCMWRRFNTCRIMSLKWLCYSYLQQLPWWRSSYRCSGHWNAIHLNMVMQCNRSAWPRTKSCLYVYKCSSVNIWNIEAGSSVVRVGHIESTPNCRKSHTYILHYTSRHAFQFKDSCQKRDVYKICRREKSEAGHCIEKRINYRVNYSDANDAYMIVYEHQEQQDCQN